MAATATAHHLNGNAAPFVRYACTTGCGLHAHSKRCTQYGNIEPTEYDTSSCKEYKKLLELICKNEEKLKSTMTDEQKELFDKYADCVREYQTITDCLIFQNSFKLGAKMMLEVMEE